MLCVVAVLECPFASATEINILKSSDIAAYNQAINGFSSALPSGMRSYPSSDSARETPGEGRKPARIDQCLYPVSPAGGA